MYSYSSAAPQGSASILVVAKDTAGRWLVQEALGRLRLHFASLDAALRFADEAPPPFAGATVAISCGPPTPPETSRGHNDKSCISPAAS